MIEIWKDIPSYEGFYQVSNLGRVKSLDRNVIYSNGNIHSYKGIILKLYKNKDGYLEVKLCKNSKNKHFLVNRLVLKSFSRLPIKEEQAAHLDGDRTNNRLENLKWCFPKENHSHRKNHGTLLQGEKNSQSKLKNEDIIQIRQKYNSGQFSQYDLAKIYNVDRSNIGYIINNKAWKHIK